LESLHQLILSYIELGGGYSGDIDNMKIVNGCLTNDNSYSILKKSDFLTLVKKNKNNNLLFLTDYVINNPSITNPEVLNNRRIADIIIELYSIELTIIDVILFPEGKRSPYDICQ
jgi:hypothetical protein